MLPNCMRDIVVSIDKSSSVSNAETQQKIEELTSSWVFGSDAIIAAAIAPSCNPPTTNAYRNTSDAFNRDLQSIFALPAFFCSSTPNLTQTMDIIQQDYVDIARVVGRVNATKSYVIFTSASDPIDINNAAEIARAMQNVTSSSIIIVAIGTSANFSAVINPPDSAFIVHGNDFCPIFRNTFVEALCYVF